MKGIEELIRESTNKAKKQKKEFLLFHRVLVRLLQPTLIDFGDFIERLEELVPSHLFDDIDEIFVGSFDENDNRELEAHYESGAIYVTNDLTTIEDYLETIIHEMAHSIEQARGLEIYADRKVEEEFRGKRETMKRILGSNNIDTSSADFSDVEYSPEFDLFLYKGIGYDVLDGLTSGLFYSPYAATSINEYFANGIENFFLENREHLKMISPQLTKKIWEIIENEI